MEVKSFFLNCCLVIGLLYRFRLLVLFLNGIMQYKDEWKIYMIWNVTNVWYEWMRKWIIDNAMYESMNVHGRMMMKEWTTSNVNETKTKTMWTNIF